MTWFTEVQVMLGSAPRVSAMDGRYIICFAPSVVAGQAPTIALLPADTAQPILSAVVRPEILSLAREQDARRLSVFPDGRILFRGEEEALFQDVPGRKGAQVSRGGTSVTIGPDGDVIIHAPLYSMLIDQGGVATLLDHRGAGAASTKVQRRPADRADPGSNVIPLRD